MSPSRRVSGRCAVTRPKFDSGVGEVSGAAKPVSERSAPAFAPPLAEVPLPAPNVEALLRRNAQDYGSRPALRFADLIWSHEELLAEAERFSALYRARLDPARPPHVGVLLDNTPDFVFALCGAGLAGVAVAGLNSHAWVSTSAATSCTPTFSS